MESYELQEELERFTTRLCDRVTHAAGPLERSARPDAREQGMRQVLRYASCATEIATGLTPEVNLLDMIVFVHLCRSVLDRYWVPQVFGSGAAELSATFAAAEGELADIADRGLGVARREQVIAIADAWIDANPGLTQVEGVRLADFSAEAGGAAATRAGQARGLLSGVKTAKNTANQAMLLSERALFLFHRVPFLWRLQARLAAREMLRDALELLSERTARIGRTTRRLLLAAGVLGTAGTVVWLRRRAAR